MSKKWAKVYPINTEIEDMNMGDLYTNNPNTKGSPYLEPLSNGTYKILSKPPEQTSTMKRRLKKHQRTSSEEARFQKRKLASQLANRSARHRGGRRYRRRKTSKRQ